jgi:GH24 family phage-related lysozyme (muramidase)
LSCAARTPSDFSLAGSSRTPLDDEPAGNCLKIRRDCMNAIVTRASAADAAFVEGHEGTVTKTYRCPAGVLTIGNGFTMGSQAFARYWHNKHGRALRMGDTITREESRFVLRQLLDAEYGPPVAGRIRPRKQHEFGGAVSVAFNCGTGALGWNWAKALAAGDVTRAAALLRTTATTANGRTLAGLVRRRREEAALIEYAVYGSAGAAPARPASVSQTAAEIRELQEALRSLGYYKGAIDGMHGPGTDAAVRAFQAAHELKVDGIAGPATRATLVRALDARLARNSTGGAGTAAGGGTAVNDGAEQAVTPDGIDPSALADTNLVLVLVIGLGAAAAVWGAFWLWRNRGRFTGRRVPT